MADYTMFDLRRLLAESVLIAGGPPEKRVEFVELPDIMPDGVVGADGTATGILTDSAECPGGDTGASVDMGASTTPSAGVPDPSTPVVPDAD